MEQVRINKKDTIIMNLTHYFITEKNYNPVIIHGIEDEIWLENMDSDYKIVRIISKYIHNNEQLNFNKFRSNQITKKLKRKTLSLRMNVLNIYVDLGDNVTELKEEDGKNISFSINSISDLKKTNIPNIFPDIIEKTNHSEKGIDFLLKITDDINSSNTTKNKKLEKIFSTKKPIITYTLIFICIIMFLISNMGYDTTTLIKYGANIKMLVQNGEVYRLLTCIFLHAGLFHIFFNMYSLYYIGSKVEDFFGKWKYLIIYLLSGISGSLLSIAFSASNVVSVGATGAIFGLFGALLYFSYKYRGYIGTIIKSQILPIVIYNLIIGFFISGIDMWAHVGGLVAGMIIANMLGTIENKKYEPTNILLFIIYFAFIIYLGLFR